MPKHQRNEAIGVLNFYLPYGSYDFDPSLLKRKLFDDMSHYSLVETNNVIAAWRPLDWDSRHFSCKMLELKYFVAEENATFEDRRAVVRKLLEEWQGYNHVTARINAIDILSAQLLESLQFSVMDTNVRYGIDLRKIQLDYSHKSDLTKEGVEYQVMQCPCSLPELFHIAETSWSRARVIPDRFHADANFPGKLADSVYTEWLKNSLTGELADSIIVTRVEGKACGFLALKHNADRIEDARIGSIGLGAVDPSMRSRGIYTNMVSFGLRILKEKAEIVETGTQITNFAAQKAWVRSGLRLVSATYVFHKWLTS